MPRDYKRALAEDERPSREAAASRLRSWASSARSCKIHRVGFDKRDPEQRVHDYKQYFALQPESELRQQGARCMDCGIPFCHEGCPLGNLIPDWNDLVYRGKWREAIDQLHATNNFPEFTGRICPAPCESACVLAINDDPVTIEQIELAIAERAFDEGWIVPDPPDRRTGKTVAVIGSGPAGLAVADELNRCGHTVTVYERDEGPGGMLRFGVPDAKLEKRIIDRRVAILAAGGDRVRLRHRRGRGPSRPQEIKRPPRRGRGGDRLARARATSTRPGRSLSGIHSAMDYLYQRNRWVAAQEGRRVAGPGAGRPRSPRRASGDRGRRRRHRDGLHLELPSRGRPDRGHARRVHGAADRRPRPTASVAASAQAHASSTYALDEGGKRRWGTEVTGFGGRDGHVSHVYARKVTGTSSRDLTPVPGSEFVLEADLVLIAIGFEGPERAGTVEQLDLELDRRGNIRTEMTYRTLDARRVRLRRRPDRPVADRHRDRRGPQVRAGRQQGPRRQPDGRRPGDAGHRRLERRGGPHAAPRGRGSRDGRAGEEFFTGPGAQGR